MAGSIVPDVFSKIAGHLTFHDVCRLGLVNRHYRVLSRAYLCGLFRRSFGVMSRILGESICEVVGLDECGSVSFTTCLICERRVCHAHGGRDFCRDCEACPCGESRYVEQLHDGRYACCPACHDVCTPCGKLSSEVWMIDGTCINCIEDDATLAGEVTELCKKCLYGLLPPSAYDWEGSICMDCVVEQSKCGICEDDGKHMCQGCFKVVCSTHLRSIGDVNACPTCFESHKKQSAHRPIFLGPRV